MGLDLSTGWGNGWGAGAVAGDVVFLPAAAAGTALAVVGSLTGLTGLTAAGVWADWPVFAAAATLEAKGLTMTFEASLGAGLTAGLLTAGFLTAGFLEAGFLSAGLGRAAALTTGSTDFLTAAFTPATGWVDLAMGFTAVLSGVFGFTGGFAVALTRGALTAGLLEEAACGRPSPADAAGSCGGVIRVF